MDTIQLTGLVIPVTVFLEASKFPTAEAAMEAYRRAKAEYDEAAAKFLPLRDMRARLVPNGIIRNGFDPDVWEDSVDYLNHQQEYELCKDGLDWVLESMGIFHPTARERLERSEEHTSELQSH